jgi:hypothetical protein
VIFTRFPWLEACLTTFRKFFLAFETAILSISFLEVRPGQWEVNAARSPTAIRRLPVRQATRPDARQSGFAATEIIVPVRWLMKSAPQPLTAPVPEADASDPVKRGQHLAEIGHCEGCHIPINQRHEFLRGMASSGGRSLLRRDFSRAAFAC